MKLEDEYESLLVSDVKRDRMFLELYVKGEQFGEVSIEEGSVVIKVFKPQIIDFWELKYSGIQKFISDIDIFLQDSNLS